ncbi:hypothetical protein Taitung27_14750 [Helicobacter pylori]|nr:hypothetical protein VN1167_14720 [Helicobacter pylori]
MGKNPYQRHREFLELFSKESFKSVQGDKEREFLAPFEGV